MLFITIAGRAEGQNEGRTHRPRVTCPRVTIDSSSTRFEISPNINQSANRVSLDCSRLHPPTEQLPMTCRSVAHPPNLHIWRDWRLCPPPFRIGHAASDAPSHLVLAGSTPVIGTAPSRAVRQKFLLLILADDTAKTSDRAWGLWPHEQRVIFLSLGPLSTSECLDFDLAAWPDKPDEMRMGCLS